MERGRKETATSHTTMWPVPMQKAGWQLPTCTPGQLIHGAPRLAALFSQLDSALSPILLYVVKMLSTHGRSHLTSFSKHSHNCSTNVSQQTTACETSWVQLSNSIRLTAAQMGTVASVHAAYDGFSRHKTCKPIKDRFSSFLHEWKGVPTRTLTKPSFGQSDRAGTFHCDPQGGVSFHGCWVFG